jgi:hypothetical protein
MCVGFVAQAGFFMVEIRLQSMMMMNLDEQET